MGREKHRVLIFGVRTYGSNPLSINLDFCNVELIPFPSGYKKLKALSEYTLIILDYAVFSDKDQATVLYQQKQEIFEKQMLEALESGTCFCFLHYDEVAPSYDQYNAKHGYMDSEDTGACYQTQIGFRWLDNSKGRPIKLSSPIISYPLRRNEFKKYMDRWGASKNVFKAYNEKYFSDIIAGKEEELLATAFSVDRRKGKLVYVPCQRDFSRPEMLSDTFATLIDSVITYLTKSRMELPEWARTPIFDEEEELAKENAHLESKLEENHEKLDIFHSAKQLLFQSEYGLEEALPKFLQEQCKIPIEREETYKEDFWLIGPAGQKVAICEVKSYVKGFKKSGLFALYSHRESHKLDENFPAALFVNANLNAASWKQKDKPIDKQDYKEAAHKHILIVRIQDLLFAWQALREGVIDANKLPSVVKDEVGWLKFKRDKSWEILK